MDLDQPLSACDPSSPGQANHTSPPCEQLPVIKNAMMSTSVTIDNNYSRHVHKGSHVLMTLTNRLCACMVCVCVHVWEEVQVRYVLYIHTYIQNYTYKYKNNWIKSKNELGLAGTKSTLAREIVSWTMVVTFWPIRLLHRCLNNLYTSCRCLNI